MIPTLTMLPEKEKRLGGERARAGRGSRAGKHMPSTSGTLGETLAVRTTSHASAGNAVTAPRGHKLRTRRGRRAFHCLLG